MQSIRHSIRHLPNVNFFSEMKMTKHIMMHYATMAVANLMPSSKAGGWGETKAV